LSFHEVQTFTNSIDLTLLGNQRKTIFIQDDWQE